MEEGFLHAIASGQIKSTLRQQQAAQSMVGRTDDYRLSINNANFLKRPEAMQSPVDVKQSAKYQPIKKNQAASFVPKLYNEMTPQALESYIDESFGESSLMVVSERWDNTTQSNSLAHDFTIMSG